MSDMSTNRIHHLGAVGLVVAVSLLLALAVRVGLTAAATGTPGLSSKGTKAYAGLHGRGRGRHHGGNQFWMWGTVSQ